LLQGSIRQAGYRLNDRKDHVGLTFLINCVNDPWLDSVTVARNPQGSFTYTSIAAFATTAASAAKITDNGGWNFHTTDDAPGDNQ
jgi:hypothetical protein